jgi:type IV secretory pathway VirB6-like protein
MLSYFLIGLLIAIGPLVIPFKVFDNKFTTEIFWKWVGMLSSCIIQPMFIVGFLSFVVLVEDQFVDGNLPTCAAGTACSFKQMMAQCTPASNCITLQPFFKFRMNATFPSNKCNGNILQNLVCGAGNVITDLVNWTAQQAGQVLNLINGLIIPVPTLKDLTLLKELFLSVCSFLIITVALRSLLDTVPEMAKHITGSMGVGLLQVAQMPLEGIIAGAAQNGTQGMLAAAKAAKSAGSSKPGAFLKGLGGGAAGVGQTIKRGLIK